MTNSDSAPTDPKIADTNGAGHATDKEFPLLALGAVGIVYGDIGTSPIYTLREALAANSVGGSSATTADVLGLLSLIIWALVLVVAVKYMYFVIRADNKGEGGILSIMALARSGFESRTGWILALGIIGASLFFGDAFITPALSVLSAVEGLEVIAPNLTSWVVPLTVGILVVLFIFQRFGTARVSFVFGPVTSVWFLALGASGLMQIIGRPEVLLAFNPVYAVNYVITHLAIGGIVIGAIFLAVTGTEALYADLGHFGRKPLVAAWFALVFPCLLLNYIGQGAFVLANPAGAANPFFEMHPDWARVPMVFLATAATVIASQAVITGGYSLVRQAVALNLLPRMTVRHTSETQSGQIYMPQVNTALLIGVILLVLGFGSSSALSHAYGLAVSGIMLITSVLLGVVMWRIWRWHLVLIASVMVPFLLIDVGFFVANAGKFMQGGWFPTLVGLVCVVVMTTWILGRKRLSDKTRRDEVPLEFLVDNLAKKKPTIVPGTAVFLTSDIEGAPTALLHSLKHYKVLHEHNVILTVITSSAPTVSDDEKVRIDAYNDLFYRVVVNFGYMETPNIPKALALARKLGWKFDIMSTSFFLSRRSLKPSPKGGLPFWVDRLFITLSKNATDATEYFHIPTGRVVEIGTQVVL